MKRQYWWGVGVLVLGGAIASGIWLIQTTDFEAESVIEDSQEEIEAGLTLRDVTLEQQDDDGNLLWRVNAKEAIYSPDQKTADLVQLDGELYQDGQLLYRVKSDKGRVQENGQAIFLEQNIVANGIQNRIVLEGETLEWRPEEDVMIVRENLTGTHPQMQIQGDEARLYDREKRVELEGNVIASTIVENPEVEPWLKFQGETMQWRWEDEQLNSEKPLRIERFQNNSVTEVLTGQKGLVELAENRVTVTDDVDVLLAEIPLTLESDQALWNIAEETVEVNRPVKIVNPEERVTVTSARGQLDLATQVVNLEQDVVVIGEDNSSRLTADRLTWNLDDQTVLAEGGVNYRQRDPQVNLQGPRAKGRIEEQTIVVDGGRVITEIVPNIE